MISNFKKLIIGLPLRMEMGVHSWMIVRHTHTHTHIHTQGDKHSTHRRTHTLASHAHMHVYTDTRTHHTPHVPRHTRTAGPQQKTKVVTHKIVISNFKKLIIGLPCQENRQVGQTRVTHKLESHG